MSVAQNIVASALRLFYRHGFHASGVDLLSQEAGVTKKTLYRHYPSKDALIDAALALRHTQFMAKMRLFVDATAAEQRPLAYIDFIANWVQEDDFHGCAFINATAEFARPDAPPHQQAVRHKQEIQTYLQDLCAIAGAQQSEPVSTQLFLIGEGLIVASQVQGYDAALVEAARAIARFLG
ncbi:TetR/AcrR family transcriptional regulator [Enterobacter mori]